MENINLIESFAEFKEFKNIDRATLMSVLEDIFRNMLLKRYGTDENFDIIINIDKGDLEIWRNRTVVENDALANPNTEITLSDAKKIDDDYEVGEEVTDEVKLQDFGRRSVLALRQNLSSRILELEKDNIYGKYKDRIGQIVVGEVYQIWKKEMLVLDEEGNELILPKQEQIPTDFFKKGDSIRAVVVRVEMRNSNPYIILSRVSPIFLERLFENEVPEIFDGLITIKNVVRAPGERAKVAVESYDDRIDPVGACVGMKGSRIHGIVRELRNENIDVINFTNNIQLYITRALNPAKINKIELDEKNKKADVYLNPEEVSLAIGKGGLNIKLASQLTGYDIDVYREIDETQEEDVKLDEFRDEIEPWVIEEFKRIGCDTAKSVLELNEEELEKRTDLEIETIRDVLNVLKAEFE
ncbi:transcription termination factor NusA [Porphyromonadaceae bacterium OttesenSCG-928-L07]|nr:transcription termination factor NusA [Porphyromonadaceae bacterium OttesenSCG-928-L07]MDL2251971.1 transcription termination factor NusA [Odoribacter sp. OttesenSCG-928-J03]MDL2283434.1 transcription termination factor NusA [Odoribacter sp. OttesenSCG-928-G04]